MRIYSLFTTMTMIGCLHMCGGPVRHSGANRVIDIRDSCPKLEKIFKSAMLQDSLESFYELIDTSDFFILALPGKKYHRVQDSIHSRDIITVSFIVNDNDTIINFSGRHGIAPPISIGMGKIFFNDKVDNAEYYVNKFSTKDFLVVQPYGSSWVNWILTFNMIVFVSIFSYNLVENIRYVKVKKNSKGKC